MYRPIDSLSDNIGQQQGSHDRCFADLPTEAPLAMPTQDLAVAPEQPGSPLPDLIAGRRLFLIGGCLVIGLLGAQEMARPMMADGTSLWDAVLGLLFFGLFSWIALGFLNALAGFAWLMNSGPGLPRWLSRPRLPTKRTAILIPIYNESVDPVFARIRTMARSIESLGLEHLFDIFVLSDSRADAEAEERLAFDDVRRDCDMAIYYRRRPENIARKPGNIAEWVRRFGAAYEHMVVLDADSLMTGTAFARLASTMEADPRIGLLQTIPAIHDARTGFARWQQFASAAYGPVASAGLQWWSGSEATFWGHNAIIRIRAFAESCGLPKLSGREPFGGEIMSHDMVEAAMLRRRGWAVHMISLPDGSYEEFPPTLPDYAVRDRRWCQGNLQHLRLLGSAGYHWVNRLQLLMGASAYLTSPLWLMLLFAGLIEPFRVTWLHWGLMPSGWLLALTAVLLLGPKVLALAWLSVDDELRERLGGTRNVIKSVALEIPVSILVAPMIMLTQTMAIIDIVRGRPSGWAVQCRDADGIPFDQAWQRYRWHVAMGALFWTAILLGVDGAMWTLPVAIGLTAAPWLAMVSARVDLGDRLAVNGIFLSAAETQRRRSTESAIPTLHAILQTHADHSLLTP
ncbi:MAG: glucans biosynthesis glucosyltransferase MdoH [Sphingomonadaceae bacterium]